MPGHKRNTAISFSFFAFAIFCVFAFDHLAHSEAFKVQLPIGFDEQFYRVPENNPMTTEKIELGKLLYFDKRLSKDGTVSCATCHNPQKGFTDQLPVSSGIRGQQGTRNAPTVLNSVFNYFQFWDGRSPSLEEQAKGPIQNPIEMGNTHEEAVKTIAGINGYKPYFQKAFGSEEVSIDKIAQAIAAFERTVISGNSAWDKFVYDKNQSALSESAQRGLKLFEGKARCTKCHVGFLLTDGLFHNLGVGMKAEKPDLGRFEVTKKETDKGAFKTPMLRDLLKTFPYMHDGSQKTLKEVVEYYNKGGEPNPWLDRQMQPLNLTDAEQADLVAFLESLEGDWTPTPEPKLPE